MMMMMMMTAGRRETPEIAVVGEVLYHLACSNSLCSQIPWPRAAASRSSGGDPALPPRLVIANPGVCGRGAGGGNGCSLPLSHCHTASHTAF
jgi:hypothetical protein